MITMGTTACRCLVAMGLLCLGLCSCEGDGPQPRAPSSNASNTAEKTANINTNANDDPKGEFLKSETGTPKAMPKPGKANIQGKVFFNLMPVEGIDVKLCAASPTLSGDCIGESYRVKTDENGQYLFADLEPKEYHGLFVRVFNTPNYIHTAKYGFLSLKIRAEADKTFFVPLTTLFKSDLKVLHPNSKAKADGQNLEISWEADPDAASYSIELLQFSGSVHHLNGERTKANSYKVEKPLPDGSYRVRVEAFNLSGIKLAQAGNGVEFSIKNSK